VSIVTGPTPVSIKPASSTVSLAAATRQRIASIDILRGLVMVLMALDHVRDFFSNALFNPLNLALTSPALFMTRWITHFCAPVFILLAGVSAFLYGTRSRTKTGLARFLLTRGLFLVIVELTLVHFGWFFTFDYHFILAQVIWTIGWSMVALAGLVFFASPGNWVCWDCNDCRPQFVRWYDPEWLRSTGSVMDCDASRRSD